MPLLAPIICFGEAFWDMMPGGRQLGGSPCNVALRLHQLGHPTQLISRVGDDELGQELLAFLLTQGLDPALVQLSATHLTGVVKANVQAESGQVSYKIVTPLAWDYIQYNDALRTAVGQASTLVYGSLAARSQVSRETLYRLLQHASFKVFDLNLRPPHYSREVVKYLLQQADLVKLNEDELTEVMEWLGCPTDATTALPWLARHFGLQAVCLTLGAAGALLYAQGTWYRSPAMAVAVKNPLGYGDAFLAALLTGWTAGQPPAECLRRACVAGAAVAGRHGTAPVLIEADLQPSPRLD